MLLVGGVLFQCTLFECKYNECNCCNASLKSGNILISLLLRFTRYTWYFNVEAIGIIFYCPFKIPSIRKHYNMIIGLSTIVRRYKFILVTRPSFHRRVNNNGSRPLASES